MGRLLLAGILLAGAFGAAASAGPTRKVKVETTPPGAAVYIEDVENGAACEATPCTIDAPLGSTTLIIRLDKYQPEFMPIDVVKGKKPMSVSLKLKGAIGTLLINSPKGASVRVNGEDQGKVPVSVEVPSEPVRVIVTQGGKTLHDDFVEVETGGELDLKVGTKAVASGGDADDGGGSGDGGDDDSGDDDAGDDSGDGDASGSITASVAMDRQHFVQLGLAFDVGFRKFEYSDGSAPFSTGGELVLGPAVELFPGRLIGVGALRGLSLFGRVQFALTSKNVMRTVGGMSEEVGATTFWGTLEVSLRQKWIFGGLVGVEASGGYVRDQVEFNVNNEMVLDQVPSADYRSVRIGGRISVERAVQPYVSGENRIVLSGGNIETRADTADATGYKVAAGITTKLGPVGARVEGSMSSYTWKFRNTTTVSPPPASGANDKIYFISFVLGYQY